MNKKRGLTPVLTTSLIIVSLVVAIGIVVVIIYNVVQSDIDVGEVSNINLNIVENSVKINDDGSVSFNIERGTDTVDLTKIKFILSDGTESEELSASATELKESESKEFKVSSKLFEQIKRISIIAIVKTKKGKEVTLSVADSIELNYLGTQVTIQKLNTICGNKKIEVGEECDDGNLNNKDGCSSQCKLESCMEQSGYVCETEKICSATTLKTNNLTQVCCNKICSTPLKTNCSNCGLMCTKDDCNSILESCYFEGGWSNTCTSCSSITCDEYKTQTDCNDDNCLKGCEWSSASGKCILEQDCGNDNLETGEQCDNGVENTNTVCTPSYGGSCSYCNTTCSLKTVGVSCGDGIKQEVEQCDNGTLNTNTACSPACGTTCYYCDTTCTQKSVVGSSCTKANGQTCTLGTQCISGNCVDGYCCASASCPTCKSCGISGSEGTCTNVGYGEQTIGCSDPTLNRNLVCVAGICNQLMWHYLNEDQTILTDSCSYPEDAKQCTLSFTGNYGWSSNYLLNPPPYWFSLYWMSYKRCQPWNSNTTVTVYKYFCDIFPA